VQLLPKWRAERSLATLLVQGNIEGTDGKDKKNPPPTPKPLQVHRIRNAVSTNPCCAHKTQWGLKEGED